MNEEKRHEVYKIVIIVAMLAVLAGGLCYRFDHKNAPNGGDSAITSTVDRAETANSDAGEAVNDARGEIGNAVQSIDNATATAKASQYIIDQCQQLARDCRNTAERITSIIATVEGANSGRTEEKGES